MRIRLLAWTIGTYALLLAGAVGGCSVARALAHSPRPSVPAPFMADAANQSSALRQTYRGMEHTLAWRVRKHMAGRR